MADLLIMEAVNLFMGDDDPSATTHLQLSSLALPTLEYVTVDHLGGGASGELSISMDALRKLEPTFKLAGFNERSYRLFGIGSSEVQTFTAYGVLRSQQTGKGKKAKAVLRAKIGKVAPDNFERANLLGHDHQMITVTRYDLHVGGKEWWAWNYFTTTRKVFGVDELAEYRQFLGLE